jgi:DNA-binding response OmpR family regulator
VAEDAVAGGHLVVKRKPDLVICDVSMPYMDGYDFIAALRADPATRAIPVVFLTMKDDVVDRARELGADFLMKPVMADELLRAVRKHLG